MSIAYDKPKFPRSSGAQFFLVLDYIVQIALEA